MGRSSTLSTAVSHVLSAMTPCRRADLHPCAVLALLLQIPADMLLMHIFIPFTVEHVRVKGAVKAAIQAWLRLVARWGFGQPTGREVLWLSPWHTVLWVLQAVSAADTSPTSWCVHGLCVLLVAGR